MKRTIIYLMYALILCNFAADLNTNQKTILMGNLKKILLGIMLMLVCGFAEAQTIEVSGTVTDSNGESVIGATVKEKGTSNGTVTDVEGNFRLQARAGATIVVSYIGYDNVEMAAGKNLKITLKEDAAELNEVVVTGYTTQRKADLTGAVSVVSVDEIAKQNENNPMKALQGRVPGMNITADGSPSGSATVRIRGIGTLNRVVNSVVCAASGGRLGCGVLFLLCELLFSGFQRFLRLFVSGCYGLFKPFDRGIAVIQFA